MWKFTDWLHKGIARGSEKKQSSRTNVSSKLTPVRSASAKFAPVITAFSRLAPALEMHSKRTPHWRFMHTPLATHAHTPLATNAHESPCNNPPFALSLHLLCHVAGLNRVMVRYCAQPRAHESQLTCGQPVRTLTFQVCTCEVNTVQHSCRHVCVGEVSLHGKWLQHGVCNKCELGHGWTKAGLC